MNILGLYEMRQVMPYVGIGTLKIYLGEVPVFVNTHTLRCLKYSARCVKCGKKGTHFLLIQEKGQPPHLRLYHRVKKTGKLILMTKDHIKPLSKGGANCQKNFQTLCEECNIKKGNRESV